MGFTIQYSPSLNGLGCSSTARHRPRTRVFSPWTTSTPYQPCCRQLPLSLATSYTNSVTYDQEACRDALKLLLDRLCDSAEAIRSLRTTGADVVRRRGACRQHSLKHSKHSMTASLTATDGPGTLGVFQYGGGCSRTALGQYRTL